MNLSDLLSNIRAMVIRPTRPRMPIYCASRNYPVHTVINCVTIWPLRDVCVTTRGTVLNSVFEGLVRAKIFLAVWLLTAFNFQVFAEGIPCWVRCNNPPK